MIFISEVPQPVTYLYGAESYNTSLLTLARDGIHDNRHGRVYIRKLYEVKDLVGCPSIQSLYVDHGNPNPLLPLEVKGRWDTRFYRYSTFTKDVNPTTSYHLWFLVYKVKVD